VIVDGSLRRLVVSVRSGEVAGLSAEPYPVT